MCFALSGRSWKDAAFLFLREVFDRNVRWLLQDHPQLGRRGGGAAVDEQRLRTTFRASRTSLRLVMFQVHFLTQVARPEGRSPAEVLESYKFSLGRPSDAVQGRLQGAAKAILAASYWPEFFARCQVPAPSPAALTRILEEAVGNSERKGYHRSRPRAAEQARRGYYPCRDGRGRRR